MGKGRIYWVSDNLVWHAYLEGNESEVRLVRGLFRQAVGLPPIPQPEVASGAKQWFVSRTLRRAQAASRPKRSASTTATVTQMTPSAEASGSQATLQRLQ
jgi:hypothetical protein